MKQRKSARTLSWSLICAGLLMYAGLLMMGLSATACNGSPDVPENPRCAEKPDGGPCRALMLRYYYDAGAGECRSFNYGGCKGHVPFETMDECKEICEAR